MEILGGYEVQVFPGDKYAKPHLFIRATYVHKISCAHGAAMLSDAAVFDGDRTIFTEEETRVLCDMAAELRATEEVEAQQKAVRQKIQAQRVYASHERKLVGMDAVQIFD